MQHKSSELMNQIKEFAEQYYLENRRSPSLRVIAEAMNIGRQTVSNYLKEMNENGMLRYNGRTIETEEISRSSDYCNVRLVGYVSCGPLEEAQEYTEMNLPFPKTVLGEGEFFAVKASGDSMIKIGISHGDIVVIKKDVSAKKGDVVLALDDNGQTTLKRYLGVKNGCAVLHPENDSMEDILVRGKLSCQGKAVYVLKDLSGI